MHFVLCVPLSMPRQIIVFSIFGLAVFAVDSTQRAPPAANHTPFSRDDQETAPHPLPREGPGKNRRFLQGRARSGGNLAFTPRAAVRNWCSSKRPAATRRSKSASSTRAAPCRSAPTSRTLPSRWTTWRSSPPGPPPRGIRSATARTGAAAAASSLFIDAPGRLRGRVDPKASFVGCQPSAHPHGIRLAGSSLRPAQGPAAGDRGNF